MGKTFGRRQVLAGSAAYATLAATRAMAELRRAPRRHTLSFSPQSAAVHDFRVRELTTFFLTIPLEAQVESLRVGVANVAPEPYSLAGICCCEGTQWEPAPGSEWAYFTFTGTSEDSLAPARTPHPCVVPGNHPNATGATNVPAIYWSDWMRYPTHAPSGRPQMLLRILVPPQMLTLTLCPPHGTNAGIVPGLRPWTVAQWQLAGDFVTEPVTPIPFPEASRILPLYVVQYKVAEPGIQIVIGGDSHVSMPMTFARQAGIALSTPALPISTWLASWGAASSNLFWPILDQAIDLARPSVCLLEGWTAGDGFGRPQDLAYEVRLRESAERVLRQGGVPVIMKAMPRRLFGDPRLAEWQWADRQLDQLVPGAVLFDPGPYVEDPAQPGDWRAGLSGDGIHPDLYGNIALREPFENLLRSLL